MKTQAPKRTKRGYAFRENLVKGCKQIALNTDRMLYEVMEEALMRYLEGDPRIAALESEIKQLKERLNVEERYRTDNESRTFKAWLKKHPQSHHTASFFQRFLEDIRIPHQAGRSEYVARLRTK